MYCLAKIGGGNSWALKNFLKQGGSETGEYASLPLGGWTPLDIVAKYFASLAERGFHCAAS